MTAAFWSGSTSAITSSMPSVRATASAVVRLSPVSITRRRPSLVQLADGFGRRVLDRIRHADAVPRAPRRPPRTSRSDPRRAATRRARPYRRRTRCRSSSSRRLPSAAVRPSIRPTTPLPDRDSKASTGPGVIPRAAAPSTIAEASGCSLPRSSEAATRSRSASVQRTERDDRGQRRLCRGQRAGLVHHQRVHALRGPRWPRRA